MPTKKSNTPRKLIRIDSVRERLGDVSRATVMRWEKARRIPRAFRIGPSLFWHVDEIEKFLEDGGV